MHKNITVNTVKYKAHGGVECIAYTASPKNLHSALPAVIIFHAWGGRDRFTCNYAEYCAELGYYGFAADIYGQAYQGHDATENASLIQPYLSDRLLLHQRIRAAIDAVRLHPSVDGAKIACIGFCFGGLCALDAARLSLDISAIISVHGLLDAYDHSQQSISTSMMILHGASDPMISQENLTRFKQEMQWRAQDWQLHIFGHAMHAFSVPSAQDAHLGTVYHPLSAQRTRCYIKMFLNEQLAQK